MWGGRDSDWVLMGGLFYDFWIGPFLAGQKSKYRPSHQLPMLDPEIVQVIHYSTWQHSTQNNMFSVTLLKLYYDIHV